MGKGTVLDIFNNSYKLVIPVFFFLAFYILFGFLTFALFIMPHILAQEYEEAYPDQAYPDDAYPEAYDEAYQDEFLKNYGDGWLDYFDY